MCVCLWILGEYCEESESLEEAFTHINSLLGEATFVLKTEEKQAQEKADQAQEEVAKVNEPTEEEVDKGQGLDQRFPRRNG